MKTGKKPRILYFIQLPPPVHGVSIINKLVYSSQVINNSYEKKLVRIQFSKKIDELRRFSIKKFIIFFTTEFQFIFSLFLFRPDLVYFSLIPVGKGFLRDSIFALTVKISGITLILHLNNRGIPKYSKNSLYKFLYRIIFRNTAIIHVSKGLLESEIESLHLNTIRTYIVENTIPYQKIKNNIQVHTNNFRILFLSNFLPEKGLYILLKAIILVKNTYKNLKVNAYGASFDKLADAKIKRFIKYNDLGDLIFIHDPIYGNDKINILSNTDLFVFPSYFEEECFPLSILEAMNAKLPIIATKIGAIPEMIENQNEGLLIEPNNPEQLAEGILFLIKNPAIRKKMGFNAYIKFQEKYSYPIFQKKMREIFERELSIKTEK